MGTHTTADGTVYTGTWSADKMNGDGRMEFPSGARYEGKQPCRGSFLTPAIMAGVIVVTCIAQALSVSSAGGVPKVKPMPGFSQDLVLMWFEEASGKNCSHAFFLNCVECI